MCNPLAPTSLVITIRGAKSSSLSRLTAIHRVFRWGSTYNLYSFLKVWVAYDGNFVEVVPAPSSKGQHCGICGNYNRQQSDEMTGKNMQKVGEVQDFVKDWEWKC